MAIRMRCLTVAVAGWIAALGAPGAAQPAPTRAPSENYAVMWLIIPDRPVEETKWVSPYSPITSARLVPRRSFELTADVSAADGRLLVAGGTQLIGVTSRTMVACMMRPPTRSAAATIWLGPRARVCLVDQDRDGRFDQYFRLGGLADIFVGAGRLPREREAIAPAAYAQNNPAAIPDLPRIYVRYGWFASLANQLIFQVCLVETGDVPCLGQGARVNRNQIPATFELLGARFRVEAKVDNQLQITMLSPVVARPLVIY